MGNDAMAAATSLATGTSGSLSIISQLAWPAAGINRAPRGATEELDYIFPDFTCTLAIIIEAATGIACWCLAVPEAALPRVCHKGASECGLLVSSQHARMMPP